MNTIFHVLDDEQKVVATILFKLEPEVVLGHEPLLGKRVWLGPPFSTNGEDLPYVIVGVAEEDEDSGKACALRLKPQQKLNS